MAIDNAAIARIITRYADLLEVDGANPFRIRAYRNAVRFLDGTAYKMAELVAQGRNLEELPGIGKILAGKIETIVKTGALPQLAELEQRVPGGLADLMELPGLGAKRVAALYHELGVTSPAELAGAIAAGKLDDFPGLAGKTLAHLREALAKRKG